jgi:hypothetical protein
LRKDDFSGFEREDFGERGLPAKIAGMKNPKKP